MTKRTGIFLAAAFLVAAAGGAQEATPGPGTLEVTVIPGGATFFTSGDHGPSFGNYELGGALTYNINRIVGFEGEVSGSIGISQDLQFGNFTGKTKTPNTVNYSGNVVISVPTHSFLVPYVTGGVGGLTMFSRESLGVNSTETFLTGNAGGGVKWYAPSSRWGVRGDYRFLATRSKDDAPVFFWTGDAIRSPGVRRGHH